MGRVKTTPNLARLVLAANLIPVLLGVTRLVLGALVPPSWTRKPVKHVETVAFNMSALRDFI